MAGPTELDPSDYTKTRCCWWWEGASVVVSGAPAGQMPLRRAVVNYRQGKTWRRVSAAAVAMKAAGRRPSKVNPYVLHHCDNLMCVNPQHLYAGNTKRPRGQHNPKVYNAAPASCAGSCVSLVCE